MQLRLSLLGSFSATLDGKHVQSFESDKVRALLAYLAVEAGFPHRRETLAAFLWPEKPEPSARHSLNQALYNLRQILGAPEQAAPLFLATPETLQFCPGETVWLDVIEFERLLESSEQHHPQTKIACPECKTRLEQAAKLYRGDFLADLSVKDSLAFEEWALVTREQLRLQMQRALGQLTGFYEQLQATDQALATAGRLVEMDPLWEQGVRQLMTLLSRQGQRSAALAQYDRLKQGLEQELGIEPDQASQALAERLRSEAAGQAAINNLPASMTAFFGRRAELVALQDQLQDPTCRLLTLLGPGGCGKTRLAIEVARSLQANFPDGVFLVLLNPLQSSDAIPAALADALGFPLQATPSPKVQLLNYLRQKRLLLVMDGFESLLEGAGYTAELLHAAPGCKILATSRARLGMKGENVYPLEGLDVPPPNGTRPAGEYSAVQLFLEAARRVNPSLNINQVDLDSVAEICRLTLGMPLGVLLASAWMGIYTPGEIAAEMRASLDFLSAGWSDVPDRQRSLRASFEYSWGLLDEREQRLLARLSVFHAGFTRQAAQQVAFAAPYELLALADKCLVQRTLEGRYQLHELVRQFAGEKLEADAGQAREAQNRHSRYYLQLLEGWSRELKSARQRETLKAVDQEVENLRAAWRWAAANQDWSGIAGALEGMGRYADLRLRFQEGELACRMAHESLANTGRDIRLDMRLLTWQSHFLNRLGEREATLSALEQGLRLLEEGQSQGLELAQERAALSFEQGEAAYYTDRASASRYYRESLDLYKELQNEWESGSALMALGELVHHGGNFPEAGTLLSESLVFLRKSGEPGRTARALRWLAFNEARLGHIGQAEQILRESAELRRATGNRLEEALANDDLGTLLSWSGKYEEGSKLLEQSLLVYQELGHRAKEIWAHSMLGMQYLLLGNYSSARAHAEAGLNLAVAADAQREMALAQFVLGGSALGEGNYQPAFDRLQESLHLYRQIDQKDELGWSLIALANATRGLGQAAQAREYLYEAAQIAVAVRGFSTVSMFISVAALFVADQGNIVKALELYSLASRFPNISQARWFEDIAWREIKQAAASLPAEDVEAALARGRARDLFATAAELLVEMKDW